MFGYYPRFPDSIRKQSSGIYFVRNPAVGMDWQSLNEFNLVEDPFHRIVYGVVLIIVSNYVFFTTASLLWQIGFVVFILVSMDIVWTAYREGST